MGNSRKIVGRLQRKARAETKSAGPPAETPYAPNGTKPEGQPARHVALKPEELVTLRKIVLDEHLAPFKPGPSPPGNHGPAPEPAAAPSAEPPDPATRDPMPHDPVPHDPISHDPAQPTPESVRKEHNVSNIETVLKEAMQIDGAIGVALVDYASGMTLGQAGGATLNLDVAAAGNTEVVRAKLRTMEALALNDSIEDILITLSSQYHLIRLLHNQAGIGLFLYLALDKGKANLALARRKLANLENQIEI